MQTLLLAAQDRTTACRDEDLLLLGSAVNTASLDALLALSTLGPPLLLSPGHWPEDRPGRATPPHCNHRFVGFGVAAQVCGAGTDRITQVRDQGSKLLRDLTVLTDGSPDAGHARLFGALHFSSPADGPPAPPWDEFPDARFVLPRWLYAQGPRGSALQLCVRAAALRDPSAWSDLQRECAQIQAALQTPAPTPPPRAIPTSPVLIAQIATKPAALDTLVRRALTQIAGGQFHKVVLARQQQIHRLDGSAFDVTAVLHDVGAHYPQCTRFALPAGSCTFVGATPELLIDKQGQRLHSDALAGSRPRPPQPNAGPTELAPDGAREQLLADDKERREHAHVVTWIRQQLARHADLDDATAAPAVRTLRNVHHLHTPIAGTLRTPGHVLDLLAALHPTPAVCGVPPAAAANFVAAHEPLQRGLYAAPIGWFDAQGDGAFYVAIRSALLRADRGWLFAGAGIVAGSDPDREYRETAAKLRPMLDALGVMS